MATAGVYDLERRYREEKTATMQICIHSYEHFIAKGTITFLAERLKLSFCGLDQMCLMIEEYLDQEWIFEDRLDYRYIDADASYHEWIYIGNENLQESLAEQTLEPKYSQKLTIRLHGRGNRSLQGELRTEKKRCYFRSGMELMRLIHQWLQIQYGTSEKDGSTCRKTRRICNI